MSQIRIYDNVNGTNGKNYLTYNGIEQLANVTLSKESGLFAFNHSDVPSPLFVEPNTSFIDRQVFDEYNDFSFHILEFLETIEMVSQTSSTSFLLQSHRISYCRLNTWLIS